MSLIVPYAYGLWTTLLTLSMSFQTMPTHPDKAEARPFVDNCGLIVNAGPDKLVCSDNPVTTLEGNVGGSGLREFEWMPPDGLSSTKSIRPTVTVSGPQCYVLTGKKKGTVNFITNGNFEMGNVGFTTDYIPGVMSCYGLGFLDCEGTYAVVTNPQTGHANFAPCGDHTSGSGAMMVCNGAPGFVNVWCQTVMVNPNRDYCISAWGASVNPSSPAQLEFSINGSPLGLLGLSTSTCVWEQLQADWNSGGNAVAQICVVNNNTVGSGNDFAIDDIEMYEICEQYDTVCVDVVDVQAVIQPPPMVCCDNPVVTLDGTGSSFGPDYTYCWIASNGGHIVSGDMTLMPVVDRPGTYTLMVKGPEGCTQEVEIEVEGNLIPPQAYAEVLDSLDCDNRFVEIFGGAFPDDNVQYTWNGPNGFFSTQPSPNVEDTGTYILTVVDECGCSSTAQVTVHAKDNVLDISIKGDSLTCTSDEALLVGLSNRPGTIWQWTGPNGYGCLSDSCIARDTGWYVLSGTNMDGCEDLDSFYVGGDLTPPDISLLPDTITCDHPNAKISIKSVRGATYAWTKDQILISNDTFFSTSVPGDYVITVVGDNGCIDSLRFSIEADTSLAKIDVRDAVIPCDSSSTQVCFDSLTTLPAFYQWTLPNGSLFSDQCFDATEEGYYTIKSTGDNGCEYVDSLFVDKMQTKPVEILPDSLIDCNINALLYRVTIPNATIEWTLPDGSTSTNDSIWIDKNGSYSYVITSPDFECEYSDTFIVTSDLVPPSITLTSDTLTCIKDTVDILVSNSQEVVSYEWRGPNGYIDQSASPKVVQPGAYEVIVTGKNGCKDTVEINVTRSADYPQIDVFSDTITCTNTQVDVFAQSDRGQVDYSWSGPNGFTSSDSIFQTGNHGTYTLTARTPEGCEIVRTIEVALDTLPPVFTIAGFDTLDCITTAIELLVNASSSYSHLEWSGPSGFTSQTNQIRITDGGVYHVIVEGQNGCITEKTIDIYQDTMKPIIAILGDSIDCEKREVTLKANGPSNAEYKWLTPLGNQIDTSSLTTFMGGRYVLTGVLPNGCESTDFYDIHVDTTAPTLNLLGGIITCSDPVVIVRSVSNGVEISWTGPGITSKGDSLRVTNAGDYKATTIGQNRCSTSQIITIPIDTASPDLTLIGDSLTCSDPIADLMAQTLSRNNLLWTSTNGQPLDSTPLLNVTSGGTYSCTVIDPNNGCIRKKNIIVEDFRDLPLTDFAIVQPNCEDHLGHISIDQIVGGNAPYLVSLNGGPFQNNRNFYDLLPGTYEFVIEDNLGCISKDTIQIENIVLAESSMQSYIELDIGDSIQLNLIVLPDNNVVEKVEWTPASGLSCDDCLSPFASPRVSTEYLVEITDTNGCVQILQVYIKVNLPQIYIPNVFTPDHSGGINDRFYPFSNLPDEVTIQRMAIFSRWGELVYSVDNFHPNDPQPGWDGYFNGQAVNPAVFVYVITADLGNGEVEIFTGDVTVLK